MDNNEDDEKDYEVGYGKPPKGTRFQKGQSGNRKGRPRSGSVSLADSLLNASKEQVVVTANGRRRRISKFEASMVQLMNKAATGDLRAIRELGHWYKKLPPSEQQNLKPPSLIINFIEKKKPGELPENKKDGEVEKKP